MSLGYQVNMSVRPPLPQPLPPVSQRSCQGLWACRGARRLIVNQLAECEPSRKPGALELVPVSPAAADQQEIINLPDFWVGEAQQIQVAREQSLVDPCGRVVVLPQVAAHSVALAVGRSAAPHAGDIRRTFASPARMYSSLRMILSSLVRL